jgi:hypothetical protein
MRSSRQSRFVTALFALVSVLFTQLAVAAYACPSMQIAQAMQAISAPAAASSHHDMPGCEGMDMDRATLCQDHGRVGPQSLDKPELPPVLPFIAAALMRALGHADPLSPESVQPAESLSLSRATAPPLAIRNCCFRI